MLPYEVRIQNMLLTVIFPCFVLVWFFHPAMQTDLVVSIGLNSMVQFKSLNMVGRTELSRVDLSCMLLDKPMQFSPLFQGRPSPLSQWCKLHIPPYFSNIYKFPLYFHSFFIFLASPYFNHYAFNYPALHMLYTPALSLYLNFISIVVLLGVPSYGRFSWRGTI